MKYAFGWGAKGKKEIKRMSGEGFQFIIFNQRESVRAAHSETINHILLKEKKMRRLITICAATVLFYSGYAMAGTWTTPQPVGGVVNTSADDFKPFLSSDGLTLYFNRVNDSNPNHHSMYQASRSTPSGPFTSLKEITSIGTNGPYDPWTSTDNLRMYYGDLGWTLKMSQRDSIADDWQMGTGINELNILGHIASPALTADELIMVFVGGDPTGDAHGADLYMANRPDRDSPFGNVVALTNVNTEFGELEPDISPDGLNLYFSFSCNGNPGIYQSTRDSVGDPFGASKPLSIFDASNYASPSMSSDGTAFYCTRWSTSGGHDIYVSYNVPEPATLLLFGLGAVMLIRKR